MFQILVYEDLLLNAQIQSILAHIFHTEEGSNIAFHYFKCDVDKICKYLNGIGILAVPIACWLLPIPYIDFFDPRLSLNVTWNSIQYLKFCSYDITEDLFAYVPRIIPQNLGASLRANDNFVIYFSQFIIFVGLKRTSVLKSIICKFFFRHRWGLIYVFSKICIRIPIFLFVIISQTGSSSSFWWTSHNSSDMKAQS